MNNCIFTPHCTEHVCDQSCPILAETSYLLERNKLQINNPVFMSQPKALDNAIKLIDDIEPGEMRVVVSNNTINVSNLLTYCAICKHWKGNRLHCSVYNLNFSSYLDELQKSWSSNKNSDELDYEKIWMNTAKVLIISNIDFVQFKDFQTQTLLNLIHTRRNNNLTTIVVSPHIDTLIGSGQFYMRMKEMFKGVSTRWQ